MPPDHHEINVQELLAKIGALVVENEWLRNQLAAHQEAAQGDGKAEADDLDNASIGLSDA